MAVIVSTTLGIIAAGVLATPRRLGQASTLDQSDRLT
jgi:hypothetical protein